MRSAFLSTAQLICYKMYMCNKNGIRGAFLSFDFAIFVAVEMFVNIFIEKMTSTPNNSISSQHFCCHQSSSAEEDFGSDGTTSVKSEPRRIISLRSGELQRRSLTDYRKKGLYNDGLFPTQLDSFLTGDTKSASLLSVTASKLKQLPEEEDGLRAIRDEVESKSSHTQTESSVSSCASRKVQYLRALKTEETEEESKTEFWDEERKPILAYKSEAMKSAEKYLESHRIFEFFQFLIAHIAAARSGKKFGFKTPILA